MEVIMDNKCLCMTVQHNTQYYRVTVVDMLIVVNTIGNRYLIMNVDSHNMLLTLCS